MSTTAKASEHIKPCNIAQCERHNRRDADYIASLNPARLYIRTELTRDNETYVAPDMVGITLQQHYDNLKALVKEKTGRAMQEKDVEYTDKKGVKRVRKGCSPIREGVVNIKPDTTIDDLLQYAERVHERWGIRAILHMHKDEGHYENLEEKTTWQPNLHAHIIWDWIDHATATLMQVADWFVWLASILGKFNANELKQAHNEVQDIADGRYDGRIQKYQQGISR